VPVFFVLSGYLICGILIDTREREGYFKIFYSRRILRVFPLYYLALLVVGLCCVLQGFSLDFQFWSHFLYIQNLVPGYASIFKIVPWRVISHLWSMGVEEQFYLLWPLVVWICPNRRVLLRVTLVLIGFTFTLRFAAPRLGLPPWFMYIWTPTRVDAILMGAVLAVIRDKPVYRWIESIGQYVVFSGLAAVGMLTLVKGYSALGTPLRAAMMISLWNIIAAGIVVAVMREGSFLCRICSMKGICWLGARSYGLYLFHVIYLFWFFGSFAPRVAHFMPLKYALLVAGASAFCLTVLLAGICYRFIEEPAMKLKTRLKYGAVRTARAAHQPSDPLYADAD
jgi:peptidoglycan/LPS O-acetylase OafA/YrhL